MQDFNQKIIKGRIGEAAEISNAGVGFAISYKQLDGGLKIPCYIHKSQTELYKNVAEYLHRENIGKDIIVIGTDVYRENQIILMVEKFFFLEEVMSKTEITKTHIDFSDE